MVKSPLALPITEGLSPSSCTGHSGLSQVTGADLSSGGYTTASHSLLALPTSFMFAQCTLGSHRGLRRPQGPLGEHIPLHRSAPGPGIASYWRHLLLLCALQFLGQRLPVPLKSSIFNVNRRAEDCIFSLFLSPKLGRASARGKKAS